MPCTRPLATNPTLCHYHQCRISTNVHSVMHRKGMVSHTTYSPSARWTIPFLVIHWELHWANSWEPSQQSFLPMDYSLPGPWVLCSMKPSMKFSVQWTIPFLVLKLLLSYNSSFTFFTDCIYSFYPSFCSAMPASIKLFIPQFKKHSVYMPLLLSVKKLASHVPWFAHNLFYAYNNCKPMVNSKHMAQPQQSTHALPDVLGWSGSVM